MVSLKTDLIDRMQRMHRARIERMREMHDVESDFTAQLLSAHSPSEATTICRKWMAKRIEFLVSEQQAVASAWLELISDSMTEPLPPGYLSLKPGLGDKRGGLQGEPPSSAPATANDAARGR